MHLCQKAPLHSHRSLNHIKRKIFDFTRESKNSYRQDKLIFMNKYKLEEQLTKVL
jgi:hypothetical protein